MDVQFSTTTRKLVQRIAVYGGAAILAAYFMAWWFTADSQARRYAVIAGLACVAVYFALLRFRFRLKTIVLIMLLVAAIYGQHCNPVYKFVNERRPTMIAKDLGARINTHNGYGSAFARQASKIAEPQTLPRKRNKTYAFQLTQKQRKQVGDRCLRALPSSEVVSVVFGKPFNAKEMARNLNQMESLQHIAFTRKCDDASLKLLPAIKHRNLIILINAEHVTRSGLESAFSSSSNVKSLELCTNENSQLRDFSCLRDSKIESLAVYVSPFFNRLMAITSATYRTDAYRLDAQDFHALAEIKSLQHLRLSIHPVSAPTELSHLAEVLRPDRNPGPRTLTKDEALLLLPGEFLDRLTTKELTIGW